MDMVISTQIALTTKNRTSNAHELYASMLATSGSGYLIVFMLSMCKHLKVMYVMMEPSLGLRVLSFPSVPSCHPSNHLELSMTWIGC